MKKINWQYALGEILIVIIGISIAFSMNKCAENTKNNKLKQQYLTSIKNDLEIDKASLENNLEELDGKIGTLQKVLPLFNANDPKKKKGIRQIFGIMQLTDFNPKDITYQSMINSGDFSLIEDFQLKTAIETHYSDYKTILKDYERQEIIHKEYVGDYFIHNMDFDAMQKGGLGFEDEKLLKNILQSMRGSFMFKKQASERGIKSCDSLINLISTKLTTP
ncbi:hypothetical protein EYD45_11400 [Hyunsoonleella flava]|uniref:Uncharacterized protein n=1 Tax=Hyunsoonleella flava TaxID=2527939 RepID=A0A4Q9FI02_9FLAO|nr:DUF6090 family protein [Hyunsoonleella flava]TBN02724.1 hypothetical protein EYD45_11400 [Hyunsoonleella flava]